MGVILQVSPLRITSLLPFKIDYHINTKTEHWTGSKSSVAPCGRKKISLKIIEQFSRKYPYSHVGASSPQ